MDDDGDGKKDLNDTDCVDYISDCGLFDCGGCRPFFDLFFVGKNGIRPRPGSIAVAQSETLIGAVSQVPLRGFELSGRASSWGNDFFIELTGDVPDEKGEPVRNVFLDTLGNRIPPLVSNMLRAPVGWIEAVERGPDLEPFAATDFLSVDLGSGPTGPSFRVRYATDPVSPGPVIPARTDGGACVHRILSVKLGPPFHRGDANGDGRLNVGDAIAVILHLFGGVPLACIEAGNADDDSTVNITDAVSLLVFLFQGGAAPPHPGPPGSPCGPDLTWSTPFIPCSSYDGC